MGLYMTIRTSNWTAGLLLAVALAFVGCGKPAQSPAPGDRVRMDLAKFTQAFPSPTPEQQGALSKVANGVRYRLYPEALTALEGLAGDTSLTEPQKKAVADMIAGITQAVTNAPPATAQ